MKLLYTRSIYLALLFILPFTTAKAVTANFTADVTSGCSPLVVHFTNTSTGATSYSWDLHNGTPPSPLTNVAGTFLTPGTYAVTLTAYNGGASSTKTMIITVLPSPTVSFYASDTAVCPGAPVTFTSTTAGGVPGPITYIWYFGDGSTGTGGSPTHSYATPGYYNITVYATNASGCTSSLTVPAYIHVFTPATPNFAASATHFCTTPGHVVFTNLSSGTPPLTYTWDFGDGTTTTTPSPIHDYSTNGTYYVKLVVTDGNGCKDSTRPAAIVVENVTASFTFPPTGCVFSNFVFTNTSTGYTTCNWDFGDGATSTAPSPVHVYSAPGTYTVTLIVSDGPCSDTVTHTVTVLTGPAGSFTISNEYPCFVPATETFTGTVPPGTIVTWLYGDGTTGSGLPCTHTYANYGFDTISMILRDPATGCIDTVTSIEALHNLVLNVIDTPNRGCIPLTVGFDVVAQSLFPLFIPVYPFAITSYNWTFGDGSAPATTTPIFHTYTTVGVFTAILTVTTANGCTLRDTMIIMTGTPPVVTFSVSPTEVCYGHPIMFYPTVVTGPVDSFAWSFGDGGILSGAPGTYSYTYSKPGIFTPTLTPYYHGCPGPPYVLPFPVIIDSPKAVIADSLMCSPRTDVKFFDASMGDDSRVWMFGDGATSTAKNPVHRYPAISTYTVTLATYNARSGCRDTTHIVVDLTVPVMNFTGRTGICKNDVDTFTSSVTGSTVFNYYWSSAGISIDSTHMIYVDSFPVTGIYTIRLIIRDQQGCYDTLTRLNYLTVARPVPNFTVTPAIGCAPLRATFTDASTDVSGTTLTSFVWAFGDGGSASVTIPTVVHTFTAAGVFTTKEIVTDNLGCKDSISRPLVTVYRPHASFVAWKVAPCIGEPDTFRNTSTGITGSYWMFGDGATSTVNSPVHAYSTTGSYTVKLVVTDAHGCTDTAVYSNYITIAHPTAGFTMSDTFTVCPPKMVYFTNTSIGGYLYFWRMGDGTYSGRRDPNDLYLTPGYYSITLIVTDSSGCKDSVTNHLTLYGYAGAFGYAPLTGCVPLTVHFHAATRNVPSIIWDFADGNVSSVSYSDTINHTYLVPGAYVPRLILSDNTGCQNSSVGIDTIKVDGIIGGFTTIPWPICLADSIHFHDTSRGYWDPVTSWYWTFTNGDTSTQKDPAYFYNVTGTYPVTLFVQDAWGCLDTIKESVTVYPPPVITASPDTVICVTDAATLTGYGGVSYTWAPPATLSCATCNPTNASPPVVTTYTVTGKDEHGCVNTDTVTVRLRTTTISAAHGAAEICRGVHVQLTDTGGTKYTWIPAAGLSSSTISNPVANPDTTTHYMIIAQLAGCIPDTNYVTVIVHPVPTVDAGPDQYVLEGQTAQLRAIGRNINGYAWDPPATLSCDTCSDPVASMSVTTTYVVNVTTDFGCRVSDTVTVHIFCNKSQLFLPNTFTPNGDGQNDVFYPRGTGISKIRWFRIYNRWGQLLFERSNIGPNDISNAWDGTYLGDTPRPDVYVWEVEAICETGEPLFVKGDVTIIH
jgi:gliding motility-associated-like protein